MFRCQSVMFYPKIYHSAALENVCVYCWTWGLASGDRGGIRYRWTMRDIRGLKRSFTPAHSKRGEGDFWNVFLYFLWVCDNSALPQTGWLSVCPGPDQRFCALQLLKKSMPRWPPSSGVTPHTGFSTSDRSSASSRKLPEAPGHNYLS